MTQSSNRDKVRVLHVVPRFVPAGAERVAAHILRHVDRSRFEPFAISLFGPVGTSLERDLLKDGIPVSFLGKRLGSDLRMVSRLRNAFGLLRPDVLHTHQYVLRYTLPAAIGFHNLSMIHTVHTIAETEVDTVGRFIHRLAYKVGRVLPVSISPAVSRSLTRVYGLQRFPVVPNGVPVSAYRPGLASKTDLRNTLHVPDDAFLFITVARIAAPKRHDLLLAAFQRVCQRFDKVRLLCAGDGPLLPRMQELARQLGLADRVSFLGTRDDVSELLGAADAFVLVSDWEGDPISIKEALSAGLPVIASAVGGVPETLRFGECGVLLDRNDLASLAAALSSIASDAELRKRLGAAGAQQAISHYDVSRMVNDYSELYSAVAAATGNHHDRWAKYLPVGHGLAE